MNEPTAQDDNKKYTHTHTRNVNAYFVFTCVQFDMIDIMKSTFL